MLIWTFFRHIEFVMNERMNTTYLALFAQITTYLLHISFENTTFLLHLCGNIGYVE